MAHRVTPDPVRIPRRPTAANEAEEERQSKLPLTAEEETDLM
jgi:hypothetical protein